MYERLGILSLDIAIKYLYRTTVRTGIIEPYAKTSEISSHEWGSRALRKLTTSASGLVQKKKVLDLTSKGNSNALA